MFTLISFVLLHFNCNNPVDIFQLFVLGLHFFTLTLFICVGSNSLEAAKEFAISLCSLYKTVINLFEYLLCEGTISQLPYKSSSISSAFIQIGTLRHDVVKEFA